MCKVSEKIFIGVGDIHPDGQNFQIFCQFDGDKSAISNLILLKLHMINRRMVVNACVEYREKMFIGVGDIHPDGQHFQIFCQFEQTKMVINRLFLILIRMKLHRIHGRIVINAFHGRMVVNACVEYREEMFIGVGDIHLDGHHFQIFCQFEQTKMTISRPF